MFTYLLTFSYSPYGLSGRKATVEEEEEAPTHRSKQDRHHQNNRPVLRWWGASQCKVAYALRGLIALSTVVGNKGPRTSKGSAFTLKPGVGQNSLVHAAASARNMVFSNTRRRGSFHFITPPHTQTPHPIVCRDLRVCNTDFSRG